MARNKGSANLAASLEVLAGAPLDARLVVDTVADLTNSSTYPYHYIGMPVVVKATGDLYILVGDDPTDSENWKKPEGGGGNIPTRTSDLINDSGFITDADVPTAVSELTNDSGFITKVVDDLTNYYTKSGTYSKAEVDGLISAAQTGRFAVVAELPTTDIQTNVIYLVPASDSGTSNIKDEYVNLDGTSAGWEKIGSTQIDLSDYVTNTELQTALADYVESADLATVATSGSYNDLTNKPTIPDKISDLTNDSDFVESSDLADVATSGSYNDLTDTPTIPGDIQYATMPLASADNEGQIVQYVGITGVYTNGYFYECVEDGGTYSWVAKEVQTGSSGGDASLANNVTSNLAVGAIASGTTLVEGTSFTEFVQKLLITEIAPTIGFSISKSGNVVYGGSYTETLTVTVSNMGTAKSITKVEWYEGNTKLGESTTSPYTYTMSTATTDTTTFKAVITYVKSNDASESTTKTASINFYYNKFYGSVSDLNPTEATVEALSTALGTGRGGTYSFTTSASRICYAYPKSLGALTSIKDGNGFSLFDSFTRTEQTYTQNGTSVAYYRYVLTDPTTVSGYSVIFA